MSSAPPDAVEIYGIGWTGRHVLIGLYAWIALFAISAGVTLASFSADKYEKKMWIIGIGAVTLLPFFLVLFAGRNFRARRPFLTLTRQGATTPNSGLIRWDAIRRVHVSESSIEKNLYLELRDSLRTERGKDRALPLREASEYASFRFVASEGEERTIVRSELASELQELHLAYAAAGGMDPQAAAPNDTAFAIPAKQEIIVLQALSDRWAGGIVGALTAAGPVAIAAIWGWVLFSVKEERPTAVEGLLALLVVASLTVVFFREARRILAESLGGRPLLIVDRSGLTHLRYGFVPWSEITSIQVDKFAGNISRTVSLKPVACAYLSKSYYHLRLKGRGYERCMLAFENSSWKSGLKPRLPLVRRVSRYVRNGLPMPLETVEELARMIREFPRADSSRFMSN